MASFAPRSSRALAALAVLASLFVCGGCVEKRLFVRTEPPGARVFLDGADRGPSPLEVGFTAYGTREVVVRAPGRPARAVMVELASPWYQLPGLDLVTDVLWPFTIEDRHEVFIALPPPLPFEDGAAAALAGRAEHARAGLGAPPRPLNPEGPAGR